MNKLLRLRGIKVDQTEEAVLPVVEQPEITFERKGRVRMGAARESGGIVELPIQPDDLACMEFSNGFKLWLRVDDLYSEHGTRTSRGAVDSEAPVWEIDPQVGSRTAVRGVSGLVIEAMEFFGVDLKAISAEKLSGWFEQKLLNSNGAALYRCSLDMPFKMDKITGVAPSADKPILVFIHGTASSSEGSFGKLWSPDNKPGARLRAQLNEKYADNVYALEHKTLTISPIDNALMLADSLPDKAELNLVSHSRGGLVGELLCLGQRDKSVDPLTPDFLERLFDKSKDRTLGELYGFEKRLPEGYPAQLSTLKKLLVLLDKKQFKITRFVRVACPARGTTLVSGRLDRWLSVLQFLTASNDAIDFLLGVVKERTDPRTLPGLEAMLPGSALISLLNYPQLKVSADLSVIAGDIEGDSTWGRMKWQLADWFFDSDHDLVVNTGSMYGGIGRQQSSARFAFDQGKEINHFNYFINERTIGLLLAGLTRTGETVTGYQPLALARHEEPRRREAAAPGVSMSPKPVAFVLPGILGTHLIVKGEPVWLNIAALTRGDLPRLGITVEHVIPQALIEDFYGDFLDYLSRSHDVVPFPYDWRRSIQDNAKELAKKIEEKLSVCETSRQPLRLVAHSMGGLVVRAMIAQDPQIWKRIQALPGSRFMMLGTPNAGSYETVRWLTGWSSTLAKLTLLDLFHDAAAIVNVVNRFPGLLELLPSNESVRDYSKREFWEQICKDAEKSWPLPLAENLQRLNNTWDLIKKSPIDTERMIYIAGWAPETVCDYENLPASRGERPPLRFYSTRKGDGTVPWALGLLPGVKTWYLEEATHEELLSHEPAFPAYLDLLQFGLTVRTELSKTEPNASRSATLAEDRKVMVVEMPDSLPAESDLSGFVFGPGRSRKTDKKHSLPRVKVSICHGNLAYARYPVCVGHYAGDTIVSAEAELDKRLEGVLSKRIRLGLYPGPLNTDKIFIHRDNIAKPGGAIVIGLGRVGEFSPGALESGMVHVLLDYALKVAEWPDDRFGPMGSTRYARISCLFIGTGFGGMTLRDSIESILNGVKAVNQRLMHTQLSDKVLIDEIEFLELYQDIAINAARELETIFLDGTMTEHFIWQEHVVREGQGGVKRVLFNDAPNWWQRLEIAYDKKRGELRFIALTDKARAEESLVAGQMSRADQFIAEAISSTANSRKLAQTLFEMLLPNRLKEFAPNKFDVVLIVDEVSARYPWELLEDRWNTSHQPPSVAAGMLRQLKTGIFRARPAHTFERSAYIVGNPKLSSDTFPDLPGAAREAQSVAKLLSNNGYQVNDKQVNLDASEILIGLHSDAYRILHLAGHGVHEFTIDGPEGSKETCGECDQPLAKSKQNVSGMVIGNNSFLTPGDVEQMRWVPELVFINCCHLGSTDCKIPESRRYNALAANLATQFIRMGVKAVVAAGWAVDDGAAESFAKAFYLHMLSGDSFGRAVCAARKNIYEQFPHANTWGAYQCYGDPDFRFDESSDDRGKNPKLVYHDPVELVTDLENLVSELRVSAADRTDLEKWEKRIANCLKSIPEELVKDWQARADVAAVLGVLNGELGKFEQAVECLDRAVHANGAEFSVKALEQRANYRVKQALNRWLIKDKEKDSVAAGADIQVAIDDLLALCRMAPTLERRALLGSAYKRQAWMQSDQKAMLSSIREMREHYKQAFDKIFETGKIHPYTLTNWLTAEAILAWNDPKHDRQWQSRVNGLCTAAIEDAHDQLNTNPDFWSSAVEPDCLLLMGLVAGIFKEEERQKIVEGYSRAFNRGASPKERSIVLEHLDFIITMAKRAKKNKLLKLLSDIRGQLA